MKFENVHLKTSFILSYLNPHIKVGVKIKILSTNGREVESSILHFLFSKTEYSCMLVIYTPIKTYRIYNIYE